MSMQNWLDKTIHDMLEVLNNFQKRNEKNYFVI